jgi:hypothetical protein
MDFKKFHNSVSRKILSHILTEFVLPMKQATLIKMCLNETNVKVRIGKYLSDKFSIQNTVKQRNALSALLFSFALE